MYLWLGVPEPQHCIKLKVCEHIGMCGHLSVMCVAIIMFDAHVGSDKTWLFASLVYAKPSGDSEAV